MLVGFGDQDMDTFDGSVILTTTTFKTLLFKHARNPNTSLVYKPE